MEHHHEPGACSCGHSHGEGDCPYHIHGHIHEGAAAVSGKLTLSGSLRDHQAAISEMLEHLAAEVWEHGGLVGHIKASVAQSSSTVFSVTKHRATVTPCDGQTLDICVVAIAFSVEVDTLANWLHEALEKLETENLLPVSVPSNAKGLSH